MPYTNAPVSVLRGGVSQFSAPQLDSGTQPGPSQLLVSKDRRPEDAYGQVVYDDVPVAWWRANGTADDHQQGTPGALIGGTYGGPVLPTLPSAQSFNLDGVDDYVSIPDQDKLDTPLITVEAWIKPDTFAATGVYRSVVSRHATWDLALVGGLPEFYLIVVPDAGGANVERNARSTTALTAGQTYHLVGTFDGTTTRLYVNGSLVQSNAGAAATVFQSTTGTMYLGAYNGSSEFFDGLHAEAALYNRALSDTEVADHYAAGSASVSLTDAGAGADTLAVSVTPALEDSAAGGDALTVTVTAALADSGAAGDALTVSAASSLTDTGSAADALSAAVTATLPDTVTGGDALTATATAPLADAATGGDALTATVTPALDDAATGGDALTVAVTVPLTDSGTGTDDLSLPGSTPKTLADTGSGADAVTVSAAPALTDTVTAGDALTVTVVLALNDTGTGVDLLSQAVAGGLRDITITVGPGASRTLSAVATGRTLAASGTGRALTAGGASRQLAAAGTSRTLTADPRE